MSSPCIVSPVGDVSRGTVVEHGRRGSTFTVLVDGVERQARAPDIFADADVEVVFDSADPKAIGKIVRVCHTRRMPDGGSQ